MSNNFEEKERPEIVVDAEEVMQQIQELKKSDITAVSKSEVKQLDNKIKELEKEAVQ